MRCNGWRFNLQTYPSHWNSNGNCVTKPNSNFRARSRATKMSCLPNRKTTFDSVRNSNHNSPAFRQSLLRKGSPCKVSVHEWSGTSINSSRTFKSFHWDSQCWRISTLCCKLKRLSSSCRKWRKLNQSGCSLRRVSRIRRCCWTPALLFSNTTTMMSSTWFEGNSKKQRWSTKLIATEWAARLPQYDRIADCWPLDSKNRNVRTNPCKRRRSVLSQS